MSKGLYGVGMGVLKPHWLDRRLQRLAPRLWDKKVVRTTDLSIRDRRIIKENL
jgi:hypothetical protein